MKSEPKYQRVDSADNQGDGDEELEHDIPRRRRYSLTQTRILLGVLICSVLCNVLFSLSSLSSRHFEHDIQSPTKFAGLTWNTLREFEYQGRYDDPDEIVAEQSWNALRYDVGSVALSNEYAKSKGLPEAQPFPWDNNKGIYFISAYHSIHCLRILRSTLLELRDDKPLSWPFFHATHCLESLLQDTICFADDTPRYTSFEHAGNSGFGQPRLCRDFNQLEAWASQHSSCWRHIQPTEEIDTLLRFRYCSEGSPYNERIHEIFGDFDDE